MAWGRPETTLLHTVAIVPCADMVAGLSWRGSAPDRDATATTQKTTTSYRVRPPKSRRRS